MPIYFHGIIVMCRNVDPHYRPVASILLNAFPTMAELEARPGATVQAPTGNRGVAESWRFCNECGGLIRGKFYQCDECFSGVFDLCLTCYSRGVRCFDDAHIMVPCIGENGKIVRQAV